MQKKIPPIKANPAYMKNTTPGVMASDKIGYVKEVRPEQNLFKNHAIPKHFPRYFKGNTSEGITKAKVERPKEKVPLF